MDKLAYRAVIFNLTKQGKKPQEIHQILQQTDGDASPSYSTVKKWSREALWGNESLEDAPRSGRPPEVISDRLINSAKAIVAEDPKISIKALAERLSLARETTKKLLDEHLQLAKPLAILTPHELTPDIRAKRVRIAQELLAAHSSNWTLFLKKLITVGETWVSYETPHTRQSAAEWRPKGSAPAEVPRLARPTGKLLAVVLVLRRRGTHWLVQIEPPASGTQWRAVRKNFNGFERSSPEKRQAQQSPAFAGQCALSLRGTCALRLAGHEGRSRPPPSLFPRPRT